MQVNRGYTQLYPVHCEDVMQSYPEGAGDQNDLKNKKKERPREGRSHVNAVWYDSIRTSAPCSRILWGQSWRTWLAH